MTDFFKRIPLEIFRAIAEYLAVNNLFELRRVSKEWNHRLSWTAVIKDAVKRYEYDGMPGTLEEKKQRMCNQFIGRPTRLTEFDAHYRFSGWRSPDQVLLFDNYVAYIAIESGKYQVVIFELSHSDLKHKETYDMDVQGSHPKLLFTDKLVGIASTTEICYVSRTDRQLERLNIPADLQCVSTVVKTYGSVLAIAINGTYFVKGLWTYDIATQTQSNIYFDKAFANPPSSSGELRYGFIFDQHSILLFLTKIEHKDLTLISFARYTIAGQLLFNESIDVVPVNHGHSLAYPTIDVLAVGIKERYHVLYRCQYGSRAIVIDAKHVPLIKTNSCSPLLWKDRAYFVITSSDKLQAAGSTSRGLTIYADMYGHHSIPRLAWLQQYTPRQSHCVAVNDRFVVRLVSDDDRVALQVLDFQGETGPGHSLEGDNGANWRWINSYKRMRED